VTGLLNRGYHVTDTLVVDRRLGEGAFAEVYRVRHAHLGPQALKIFKRVASVEGTKALLGEAQLLSTLGHPNIIRVFDANTVRTPEGLRGYFTMEYIPGGNLEQLIKEHRPAVPTEIVITVLEQIAEGLAIAHDQTPPVLHRDVTLANILVGREDTGPRVRISDFGLAKRADPLTRLAAAQGTYAFMAPEVLRNEGYSCASDVWSVGTIAYLLLTNRFPFDDDGPFPWFSRTGFSRGPLPPSSYNPEVDAELDRVVLAALETDQRDRPATARVLADALRERRAAARDDRTPPSRAEPATTVPPCERARRLAEAAIALSRVPGELAHAADLMEEAIDTASAYRRLHQFRIELWRRGVTL
jgi:serine/threonine protein kinase